MKQKLIVNMLEKNDQKVLTKVGVDIIIENEQL